MEGSELNVIVAEDEDLVRVSISDMVGVAGHMVMQAVPSGEAALAAAAAGGADIVLMDIHMPGIGGIEAARRILALPRPVPVVLLSALADEKVAVDAAEARGFGYLGKPFHTEQLGPVMRTAIHRFREWRDRHAPAAPQDSARQPLDRWRADALSLPLDAAVERLLAMVGEELGAEGVLVCLVDNQAARPSLPARWGVPPPEDAMLWLVTAVSAGEPCEGRVGPLQGPRMLVRAAPLNIGAGMRGLLAAFTPPDEGASPNALDHLRAYAARLGELLAARRTADPVAWRQWL